MNKISMEDREQIVRDALAKRDALLCQSNGRASTTDLEQILTAAKRFRPSTCGHEWEAGFLSGADYWRTFLPPASEALASRGADAVQGEPSGTETEHFRELGAFLARVLDEDHWATAEKMLLGGLLAVQEGRDIQGDIDHYNGND